ncbi:hypothetical protein [Amycolatopsis alkalitolerans]|uniref:Uncharacterized protein n=1 Tax=Amycolatopsis alkalitolerans TaxID=2547244 RepID=A0A5C4M3E4_9PSEU|nr:hypothetical protein [Amycolatopsis alkalitolerans]TNC26413.1 hypothetical protein FG385_11695 [Amycolatopsis alkalitolerans]
MQPAAYREHFGWMVDDRENPPRLLLGHNMVALTMPRTRGVAVLEYLCRQDIRSPVLEPDLGSWAFLADSNGLVLTPGDLPEDVKLLGCGAMLPVPLTTANPAVRWVVAPDVRQRWLPSLAALMAAVRTMARFR